MPKYLVNPKNQFNQVVTEVPGGVTLKPGQIVEFDEPMATKIMSLYPGLLQFQPAVKPPENPEGEGKDGDGEGKKKGKPQDPARGSEVVTK